MKPTGLLAAVIGLSLVTSVPVSAREAGQLDWQIAYQKVLTTYSRMQGFQGGASKEDLGSRWDLYDVNGDGTPELFISPDNSHANGVMVYTCLSGDPKLLQADGQQAFGEFGLTAVNAQGHMIGSFHTGSGVEMRSYYRLEKGELVLIDSFMNDEESYPDTQKNKAVWQHNEKSISKEEYETAYAPYADIVWKEDVGRRYAFNDRSPLASELQNAGAADPPDMKTALIAGSAAALVVALVAGIVSKLIRR